MSATVTEVVEELASEGYDRFHASHVAQKTHTALDETRRTLAELVETGALTERFEVICSNCGRTTQTFASAAEVPIGAEFECESCDRETFTVGPENVWISFEPTRELLVRVNRERGGSGGKKGLRQVLMTPLLRLCKRLTHATW